MPTSPWSRPAYGATVGTLAVSAQSPWSGQSRGWRYLAQRIDGTGLPGVFVENELPLTNVKITDVLSGPPQLTADISPAYRDLIGSDGLPLLHEWGTVIYAEADGLIRAGCILVDSKINGPVITLDCVGFSGYPLNMVYPGADGFSNTDALDIVRTIWTKIQIDNGSNLGLQVDPYTKAGVLIGTPPDANGQGPYWLTWWGSTNLQSEIDKLAAFCPFDYHERHVWNADRTDVIHHLDFGAPSLGRRRTDLRFVFGENIQTDPKPEDDGNSFSNHVLFLGAGTGSAQIRAEARVADGRLRRMVTVSDSTIVDNTTAAMAARMELARRSQMLQLSQIYIHNHPNAPLGSFGVGDEIRVQAETYWAAFDIWCRVISLEIDPEQPDLMLATLIRSDWVL